MFDFNGDGKFDATDLFFIDMILGEDESGTDPHDDDDEFEDDSDLDDEY